jgi:hypothetical protein
VALSTITLTPNPICIASIEKKIKQLKQTYYLAAKTLLCGDSNTSLNENDFITHLL